MMASSLHERRILVVEDEYYLARELADGLMGEGAAVIGPAASVGDALDLINDQRDLHGAILDVNLSGEYVFTLADDLIVRGVPLIFTTGYDRTALPDRFAAVPVCEKPVNLHRILAALREVVLH